MFPLIETAIGFLAVMLLLSLLVKSLTSLIKDHFDFYSDNLRYETNRLIRNTVGKTLTQLEQDPAHAWLHDLDWRRVGTEIFNKGNAEWFLKKLGADAAAGDLDNLEGRLQAHTARVQYMFEQRMRNLSIAVGLGLCLLVDINAFKIWQALYTSDQLRTTFASEVATRALIESRQAAPLANAPAAQDSSGAAAARQQPVVQVGNPPAAQPAPAAGAVPAQTPAVVQAAVTDETLTEARKNFAASLTSFTTEVSFGVGGIWKNQIIGRQNLIVELLAALLTGILVSVGAPYWHDLLESLSSLRKNKT